MRERIDNALTREELDDLKPSTEDLFHDTWRGEKWYNEAINTAANEFVMAAQESEKFREDFLSDVKREIEMGVHTVEIAAWRETMQEKTPEHHSNVMGIGLSATQGSFAEETARTIIEEELEQQG
jgi:septin family protein